MPCQVELGPLNVFLLQKQFLCPLFKFRCEINTYICFQSFEFSESSILQLEDPDCEEGSNPPCESVFSLNAEKILVRSFTNTHTHTLIRSRTATTCNSFLQKKNFKFLRFLLVFVNLSSVLWPKFLCLTLFYFWVNLEHLLAAYFLYC